MSSCGYPPTSERYYFDKIDIKDISILILTYPLCYSTAPNRLFCVAFSTVLANANTLPYCPMYFFISLVSSKYARTYSLSLHALRSLYAKSKRLLYYLLIQNGLSGSFYSSILRESRKETVSSWSLMKVLSKEYPRIPRDDFIVHFTVGGLYFDSSLCNEAALLLNVESSVLLRFWKLT